MSDYRYSNNPWNGNYATPKGIRDEDWQRAPVPDGLPGGFPLRSENFKLSSGYYATGDVGGFQIPAAVNIAVGAACAYHGYKRNGSALWGLLWGVFGHALPIVAGPFALAQGFGKRK
jgi:hypothetical protein